MMLLSICRKPSLGLAEDQSPVQACRPSGSENAITRTCQELQFRFPLNTPKIRPTIVAECMRLCAFQPGSYPERSVYVASQQTEFPPIWRGCNLNWILGGQQ